MRVHHAHIAIQRRLPRRAELGRDPAAAEKRGERRRLGKTVTLAQADAARLVSAQQRLGHRRAAADQDVDAGEIRAGEAWMLRHEQEHRGRAEHRRDAVARDVREHQCRIEAAVQHHVPAALQPDQRGDVQPADMEHRRGGEAHVAGEILRPEACVDVVPEDIAVRQHRALGPPGGARGVHDQRHVVGLDAFSRGERHNVGDEVLESCPRAASRLRGQVVTATECAADRIDHRLVRVIDQQRVHPGVVDDELQLRAGEAEIQRHEDRADRRCREQRLEEYRVVVAEERNTVTTVDARLAQRASQAADTLPEGRVTQRLAFETDRRQLRHQRRPAQDHRPEADVGQRHLTHASQPPWAWAAGSTRARASAPARRPCSTGT